MSSFLNDRSNNEDEDDYHPPPPSQLPQPSLDARFSCSICTEAVMEPVVTHCGHLYCWSCLYRWLEHGMTVQERNELFGNSSSTSSAWHNQNPYYDPSKRVCPVCRAPCSVKRVIPIYVRTDATLTTTNTTTATTTTAPSTRTTYTGTSASTTLQEENDDDILHSIETVMNDEDENGENDVVLNENNDDDDDDDGMVLRDDVQTTSHHHHHPSMTSTLHATGIRNRSRIRTSISETSRHGIGEDIDYEDNNNHHHIPTTQTTTMDDHHSTATVVPRRPVARSSSNLRLAEHADVAAAAVFQQQQQQSRTSSISSQHQQQLPPHHPASLAHGMLPLVQQAIRHAAIVAGTNTTTMNHNDSIPSIHRLEGMHQNMNHPNQNTNAQSPNYGISMDYDSTSTDFLSWILLLLGIFVLACLILF